MIKQNKSAATASHDSHKIKSARVAAANHAVAASRAAAASNDSHKIKSTRVAAASHAAASRSNC